MFGGETFESKLINLFQSTVAISKRLVPVRPGCVALSNHVARVQCVLSDNTIKRQIKSIQYYKHLTSNEGAIRIGSEAIGSRFLYISRR